MSSSFGELKLSGCESKRVRASSRSHWGFGNSSQRNTKSEMRCGLALESSAIAVDVQEQEIGGRQAETALQSNISVCE